MPSYAASDDRNLLVGAGVIYLDRLTDAGVKTGLLDAGNVDTMELTTEDDKISKKSSRTAAKPTLKEVTRSREVILRLTAGEFNAENIALALMGEVDATFTQAATPIVDEIISTSIIRGGYYKFSKLGPHTAITVEEGPAPGSALVLGTDYRIVDATVGLVQVLPGTTTLINGDSLIASYTPTAYTAGSIKQVKGGLKSKIEAQLLYISDPTTGPKMMIEFWRVTLGPDGPFGLITEEFADMTLRLQLLDDTTGLYGGSSSYPLYKVTYLP